MIKQLKNPRSLDSGTPEGRSSLVKTKVSLKTLSKLLLSITKVFVRKGKGPSWGSSSTYPTYLATATGQVENAVGERKLDQVSGCTMLTSCARLTWRCSNVAPWASPRGSRRELFTNSLD